MMRCTESFGHRTVPNLAPEGGWASWGRLVPNVTRFPLVVSRWARSLVILVRGPWSIGALPGSPVTLVDHYRKLEYLYRWYFYVFFIYTEKYQLLCGFQNISTKKYKNPQNNCIIFLCVTTHTKKIYTHRKMSIFLSVFIELTEKYYACTGKLQLFRGFL
jgi:hypothetical protein